MRMHRTCTTLYFLGLASAPVFGSAASGGRGMVVSERHILKCSRNPDRPSDQRIFSFLLITNKQARGGMTICFLESQARKKLKEDRW